MRIAGHPVHVMLVHFPVALWPAHWVLHVFHARLPVDSVGAVAFWLLLAGTVVGWVAAVAGAPEWLRVTGGSDEAAMRNANVHAIVNGAVLLAFTVLTAREAAQYPHVVHAPRILIGEAVVLAAMAIGNYFGGAVIWSAHPTVASARGQRAE